MGANLRELVAPEGMRLVGNLAHLIAIHISNLAFDRHLASTGENPPDNISIISGQIDCHRVAIAHRKGHASFTLSDASAGNGEDVSESDLPNQGLSVARHELVVHFVTSVVGCFIHYAGEFTIS